MWTTIEQTLLRIYCSEDDHGDGGPLYQLLVLKAREMGLAGATVLRGPMGFGCMTSTHRPTPISSGLDGSWERVVGNRLRHHPRA